MTDIPTSARVQATALRAAFPDYAINVLWSKGDKPRYEAVSRDGGDPYCLISSDAREIWRELREAASRPRPPERHLTAVADPERQHEPDDGITLAVKCKGPGQTGEQAP